MESSITRAELAFLLRRAGLVVPDATLDEVHGVHGYLEAMVERVRPNGASDPALVFTPVEETP